MDERQLWRRHSRHREFPLLDGPWFKAFVALCVVAGLVGIAVELFLWIGAAHWLWTH